MACCAAARRGSLDRWSQSMGGKRCLRDKVLVEKPWKSVRYERMYVKADASVSAAWRVCPPLSRALVLNCCCEEPQTAASLQEPATTEVAAGQVALREHAGDLRRRCGIWSRRRHASSSLGSMPAYPIPATCTLRSALTSWCPPLCCEHGTCSPCKTAQMRSGAFPGRPCALTMSRGVTYLGPLEKGYCQARSDELAWKRRRQRRVVMGMDSGWLQGRIQRRMHCTRVSWL